MLYKKKGAFQSHHNLQKPILHNVIVIIGVIVYGKLINSILGMV